MGELIPQEAYRFVYFFVTVILVLFSTGTKPPIAPENPKTSYRKALWVGIFFIIFFGTRPIVGIWMADTGGYAATFDAVARHSISPNLDRSDHELVWHWIMDGMALGGWHVWSWFTLIAAIYIFANIWGIRRIFPNHIFIVFVFYISFFLFYSGGINGIRNAAAYSLVFLALSLYKTSGRLSYVLMFALCLVAYQIHTSVIVTILAFFISLYLVKNTRLALLIWCAAIAISLAGGNYLANIAAGFIEDDRANKYLMYAGNSKMMEGFSRTGFRWDFLIFSSLPILLGWYATVTKGIHDKFYQILLNTYIIANAVWIIFIYAAFSNRFAMLSWCLYPYVLCYPLMKFKLWEYGTRSRNTTILLWVMLLFSGYINVFI